MTRLLIIFSSFFVFMISCIVMFSIKYNVVKKEEMLYDINKEIADNQKEIHILKAEFAHLTSPENLRSLADKYTNLSAIKGFQIVNIDELLNNQYHITNVGFQK